MEESIAMKTMGTLGSIAQDAAEEFMARTGCTSCTIITTAEVVSEDGATKSMNVIRFAGSRYAHYGAVRTAAIRIDESDRIEMRRANRCREDEE